jgi:hypothetical protein
VAPQKLALTSPTSGGSSVGIVGTRTEATEFVLLAYVHLGVPETSRAEPLCWLINNLQKVYAFSYALTCLFIECIRNWTEHYYSAGTLRESITTTIQRNIRSSRKS